MDEWLAVLLKIAGMFLVMLAGWVARRRGYLTAADAKTLSRLIVDLALPALILQQMLTGIDGAALRANWFVPLLAIPTIGGGALLGLILAPLFTRKGLERSTFIFVIAISNWIYLPLPIAATLFGSDGTLVVLLYHVGALVLLWTLGLWILRGGKSNSGALRELLTNPGLIATFAGIALALALPSGWADSGGVGGHSARVVLDALGLVGSLTIPLSLLLIGVQLAGLHLNAQVRTRPLVGVLLGRLVFVPVVILGLGAIALSAGASMPDSTRLTTYLIASMPVAVNCGVFAERFGGDVPLASRAVFYSTLLSVVTVPSLLFVARALGL